MKRWLMGTVLLVFFAMVGEVWAESGSHQTRTLFLQAVEAYKKGDYETSVRLNSEALATGIESAALHYNLGNSYLRLRKVGLAIASYLRAQRLSPGDVDVLANLNYARGMVSAALVPVDVRPFWTVPFQKLSFDELRWSALLALMFTATVVLAALYAGWKPRKVWCGAIMGGVLFIYLLMGVSYRLDMDSALGVCVDRVEVKFEPAPQATTYYKLPEGAEIRILREKDGWLKIERADHKAGWAPAQAVSRI